MKIVKENLIPTKSKVAEIPGLYNAFQERKNTFNSKSYKVLDYFKVNNNEYILLIKYQNLYNNIHVGIYSYTLSPKLLDNINNKFRMSISHNTKQEIIDKFNELKEENNKTNEAFLPAKNLFPFKMTIKHSPISNIKYYVFRLYSEEENDNIKKYTIQYTYWSDSKNLFFYIKGMRSAIEIAKDIKTLEEAKEFILKDYSSQSK